MKAWERSRPVDTVEDSGGGATEVSDPDFFAHPALASSTNASTASAPCRNAPRDPWGVTTARHSGTRPGRWAPAAGFQRDDTALLLLRLLRGGLLLSGLADGLGLRLPGRDRALHRAL